MTNPLQNPFYYLDNFHLVLDWIDARYNDLLLATEHQFIDRFRNLPQPSQALLVRMVMRKGELFCASKLLYEEIGCPLEAARPLVELGWIDDRPLLALEQLFSLLKKAEIAEAFRLSRQDAGARKQDLLETLRSQKSMFSENQSFGAWHPDSDDCVFQVRVVTLCDRLRLMFFGNLHQDWTEFVLSDLGIFKYETVEFSTSSRGFLARQDIDGYLHIHHCWERFLQGESPQDILPDLGFQYENVWLENRRTKLLFQIAQYYERMNELPDALRIYRECSYPGARLRAIRVLERSEQCDIAFRTAQEAQAQPESEAERQQLARIVPRLRRKLGLAKTAERSTAFSAPARFDLTLDKPEADHFVEEVVRTHLTREQQVAAVAPAYYVENALINSLFGLLCWNAIFAPLPGAFFHPFHTGPADLLTPDFRARREREFADCLALLDSDLYKKTILQNFQRKSGIQSPFVYWEVLSAELLDLALHCIPASHLKKCFERILLDIKSNRSGLPDLIQFWPDERRYQMIEVKGPGDRLQDNQLRWLDYCSAHDIPVAVCYVQWTESGN